MEAVSGSGDEKAGTPALYPENSTAVEKGRRDKSDLANEKLELETRLLAWQLSSAGRALEWLKAASVFIVIVGVAVSFYVGRGQIRQAEENRNADRFDKALSRLANAGEPIQQVTGVYGLRVFAFDPTSSLQAAALNSLVAALHKIDPQVQGTILEVFSDLKSSKLSPARSANVLKTAIEQNRILASALDEKWDRDTNAEKSRVGDPLWALSEVITALVRLGATSGDFKRIYCRGCDFSGVRLPGTHFDGSILIDANFTGAYLAGASFQNADIRGAIFFHSDLTSAHLTYSPRPPHRIEIVGARESVPVLECSDLRGADLSGQPLLAYLRVGLRKPVGEVYGPVMTNSVIDNTTKLARLGVITFTVVSNAEIKADNLDLEYLPPDPIITVNKGEYSKIYRTADVRSADLIQLSEIANDDIPKTREEVKSKMKVALDQPPLLKIDLIKSLSGAFTGALGGAKPLRNEQYSCLDRQAPDRNSLILVGKR
jgi:hypothetical protein